MDCETTDLGRRNMRIQLSDHFTYKRLLRFTVPTILMMIFTSLYTIVDGFFVSNYIGKSAFAAINLAMPILMGIGTIGLMIGAGGSAIVTKTLGEGKKTRANQYFSMLVYAGATLSFLFGVIGFVFARTIFSSFGATGELLENCMVYGRILLITSPTFVLQMSFHAFFVAAEKPSLGLKVTIVAGLINVILDYFLIVVFHWGISGAAVATLIGQMVGAFVPILYFSKKNSSLLKFEKARFNGLVLYKALLNGSSEMVTHVSASIVTILYNLQLMKMAGENGVAAYGVIQYITFLFTSMFMGYSIGSAPIASYNYGAENHFELKNLFRKSLKLLLFAGLFLTITSEILKEPIIYIFASYDAELFRLTSHGLGIYLLAFLIMGLNIWGSAFFTALNNGIISASISLLRTLVFQVIAILVLPKLLGPNGIWWAIVVAELMTLIVTISLLIIKRKQYHYA
jgi:putative MATE family efflux protein